MKNIIRKSLIIASLYYAMVMIGCIKNQCNCPIPKTGKFKYTDLTAANQICGFYNGQTFSMSIFSGDTLKRDEYGIRFEFIYRTASNFRSRFPKFNFSNYAYACSCVEDKFTSTETIKYIGIYTLLDFDEKHSAGSDITEYFKNVVPDYSTKSFTFEQAFPEGYTDFNYHYSSDGKKEVALLLKKSVPESKNVAFELRIEYDNGNTTSIKTKPVFLK